MKCEIVVFPDLGSSWTFSPQHVLVQLPEVYPLFFLMRGNSTLRRFASQIPHLLGDISTNYLGVGGFSISFGRWFHTWPIALLETYRSNLEYVSSTPFYAPL